MSNNPRYKNYTARQNARARLKAQGLPCALCGRDIDYTLDWWIDPKDGKRKRHPYSFEVDEIVPISLGGSPTDPANLQPAHRICNQRKGNGTSKKARRRAAKRKEKARRLNSCDW